MPPTLDRAADDARTPGVHAVTTADPQRPGGLRLGHKPRRLSRPRSSEGEHPVGNREVAASKAAAGSHFLVRDRLHEKVHNGIRFVCTCAGWAAIIPRTDLDTKTLRAIKGAIERRHGAHMRDAT